MITKGMKEVRALIKISELQAKDIVNMENGKRLGYLTDVEIHVETGKVTALIINGSGKMMGLFGKGVADIVIPWENIIRIGSDVILVEVPSMFNKSSYPFNTISPS